MKRYKKQAEETTNSTVYKKVLNKDRCRLKCAICPPNKGCSIKQNSKYGSKKPKYKDKK